MRLSVWENEYAIVIIFIYLKLIWLLNLIKFNEYDKTNNSGFSMLYRLGKQKTWAELYINAFE